MDAEEFRRAAYSAVDDRPLEEGEKWVDIQKDIESKIMPGLTRLVALGWLKKALRSVLAEGLVPFYLTVTLGTTSTCAVDRFQEIAEVKREYPNLWIHVDAAHAGAALLLEEYHVAADKFDTSCQFLPRREPLVFARSITPSYLQNAYSASDLVTDYRGWQIPLGRRFRAPKIWSPPAYEAALTDKRDVLASDHIEKKVMLVQKALIFLLWMILPTRPTPTQILAAPGPFEVDASADAPTCSNDRSCERKGRAYWWELQLVLAQKHPQDRSRGKAIFDRDYGCEYLPAFMTNSLRRIRPVLEFHRFEWELVEAFGAFSKDPATGQDSPETAYKDMFYTAKGLILAVENSRMLDQRKTLPFSEVLYQAWHVAQGYDDERKRRGVPPGHPGGGPISNLKLMVQIDVRNEETLNVLQAIWLANHLDYNVGDGAWYEFNLKHPDWFFALIGTVNVKSTVFLLRDHAAEIGKKTIKGIH
ncbi:MAG: hypothetical protein Q9177_002923, partial [Variospora cf. flavescens]